MANHFTSSLILCLSPTRKVLISPVPACSRLFPPVPACSRLFPPVPACSRLFPPVFVALRWRWTALLALSPFVLLSFPFLLLSQQLVTPTASKTPCVPSPPPPPSWAHIYIEPSHGVFPPLEVAGGAQALVDCTLPGPRRSCTCHRVGRLWTTLDDFGRLQTNLDDSGRLWTTLDDFERPSVSETTLSCLKQPFRV